MKHSPKTHTYIPMISIESAIFILQREKNVVYTPALFACRLPCVPYVYGTPELPHNHCRHNISAVLFATDFNLIPLMVLLKCVGPRATPNTN